MFPTKFFARPRCEINYQATSGKYDHSFKSASNPVLQNSKTDRNLFACFACGKSYTLKHNLKRHLATHSGLKPFPCKICGKHFIRRDTCLDHVRTVHLNFKNA